MPKMKTKSSAKKRFKVTATGKVMAGLMALAADRTLAPDANVMFLHTGGTPALFAYGAQLQNWLKP